ncbi:MAG TPA: glycosyltransferase family 39 protein [Xenococcaceae cyanobacterium]
MKQISSIFQTLFTTKTQQIALDLLILIFPLGLMTFGLGMYGLYEPHESHFAMVGREMVWREDWITPYLNGAPYLNKPPLLYWLIAGFTSIFGNTEFVVRLPGAIAGWLGVILAWRWSRDLWGVDASRIAVLMMSVTFGWFIFTHQVLIDIVLATLILASNYSFWKFLSNPKSWLSWFSCCFCLGLGLLAKGLIAVFIPVTIWLIVGAINFRFFKFNYLKLFSGILLILALVLPWFIAVEKANPGFISYFVFNEHLDRLLDKRVPPDYEVAKISIKGYLGFTVIWCFPWIIFLPAVIQNIWQKLTLKQYKLIVDNKKYHNAFLLLTLAFLLPILIFLPVPSRLIYYSLPALPPYIILCAGFYQEKLLRSNQRFLFKHHQPQKITNNLIYGLILSLIGLGICFCLLLLPNLLSLFPIISQQPTINSLIIAIAITLSLGWLIAGIEMLRDNSRTSLIVLVASLVLLYSTTIIGFIGYQNIRSSKNFVETLEQNIWLHLDTLWIFEGSREVGTAAGISYYLNQGKDYLKNQILEPNTTQLPAGWSEGKNNRVYRTVLILADGGANRLPPKFPGKQPDYLINQQQLQAYWDSNRPVVFVTDFLRKPQDLSDPLTQNLPQGANQPLFEIGQRKIYGNQMTELLYYYNLLLRSVNQELE